MTFVVLSTAEVAQTAHAATLLNGHCWKHPISTRSALYAGPVRRSITDTRGQFCSSLGELMCRTGWALAAISGLPRRPHSSAPGRYNQLLSLSWQNAGCAFRVNKDIDHLAVF
ncbi:hypothetical protein IG631_18393 [Alternaria alternata]|nr:hypothetical protein IG631_18393 [Alternaria alternata]